MPDCDGCGFPLVAEHAHNTCRNCGLIVHCCEGAPAGLLPAEAHVDYPVGSDPALPNHPDPLPPGWRVEKTSREAFDGKHPRVEWREYRRSEQ